MSTEKLTDVNKSFKTYGEALSYARKLRGLKQVQLAELTEIDQSAISRWEKTGVTPIPLNQRLLEQVLNISITPVEDEFILSRSQFDDRVSEKGVVYADEVELEEGDKFSRDEMKELLRQIEAIARILKDSL